MSLDWGALDRWVMGEAWTGSRMEAHVRELCDHIGPRWSSSEAERQATHYIRDQMEADGGLPGDNMEARIVRTLLVMLAIVSNEAKQTNPVDIYGAHFQRMWSFVRANLGEVSDGGYQKSIRALLKRLSPTKGWAGHKGEWLSIYATTDDDALDTAWQAILLAR